MPISRTTRSALALAVLLVAACGRFDDDDPAPAAAVEAPVAAPGDGATPTAPGGGATATGYDASVGAFVAFLKALVADDAAEPIAIDRAPPADDAAEPVPLS